MADKWDWFRDELSGFKAISKLPVILKFLRGRVSGPDDITKCTLCPNMCRHACPVGIVDGHETTSPSGKSRIGLFLRDKDLEMNNENIFPMYMCLSCGCCEKYCPFDFSVSDILHPLKTKMIEKNVVFDEFRTALDNLRKYGYVYGELKAHKKIIPTSKISKGRILYISGCSFREHFPDIVDKSLDLFVKLGFNVSTIPKEKCCGIPAYNFGDMKIFKKLAEENTKIINDFAVDYIVTSCPSCTYAYRVLYPENGFEIKHKILHVTEFLNENNFKLKLKKEKNISVTFHDPCKLVHGLKNPNVFGDVLEKTDGVTVHKPWRNGENTFCCGYGGSAICRINPNLADEIALERINELSNYSNTIITSCPSCKQAFEKAKKIHHFNIEVLDLVELIDMLQKEL